MSFLGQVQYWSQGLVLFTSRVGRPTGHGVLLPEFLPRTGTSVEACRQAKFLFGGFYLKFNFGFGDILSVCPAGSIFGISAPRPDVHCIYEGALVFCYSFPRAQYYSVWLCSVGKYFFV